MSKVNEKEANVAYESLALSALEYVKAKSPEKTICTKQFQNVIRDYCGAHEKEEITWRNTTFPTLTSFVLALEQKGHVTLSDDKSRIVTINEKQEIAVKSERKPKKKQISPSKKPTNKENEINSKKDDSPSKSSPSKRRNPLEDLSVSTRKRPAKKVARALPIANNSPGSAAVLCPVCQQSLSSLDDAAVNTHIDDCLTRNFLRTENNTNHNNNNQPAPPPIDPSSFFKNGSTQYVTQILETNLTNPLECTICFEPFLRGEHTVRFECLCVYHADCFAKWKKQSQYCPLHVPLTKK